jgi:NAD(P)-dependent dehydrogenase (short-subunit alcohol dehydrogenase family)
VVRGHRGGDATLHDLDWTARAWNGTQAYSDSKLFMTAFASLIARRWPDVRSNAVDPGWVPTRMGGPGAPDDLVQGHVTQVWLAASSEPDAMASGGYWRTISAGTHPPPQPPMSRSRIACSTT